MNINALDIKQLNVIENFINGENILINPIYQ